jgi:hypothetical protein
MVSRTSGLGQLKPICVWAMDDKEHGIAQIRILLVQASTEDGA